MTILSLAVEREWSQRAGAAEIDALWKIVFLCLSTMDYKDTL